LIRHQYQSITDGQTERHTSFNSTVCTMQESQSSYQRMKNNWMTRSRPTSDDISSWLVIWCYEIKAKNRICIADFGLDL